jgi:hypothetical protein
MNLSAVSWPVDNLAGHRACVPFLVDRHLPIDDGVCYHMSYMKRTTIFVPESLERDLQLHARRQRKAVAWVVREALAEYLATRRPTPALPSFTGIGGSGRTDIAERHEELLWPEPHGQETTATASASPRRSRKRTRGR